LTGNGSGMVGKFKAYRLKGGAFCEEKKRE